MKKTEAISNFLTSKAPEDLANLYNPDMEVQVNVAQDSGERQTGEYRSKRFISYTDGIETWKSFRIPYNAATIPEYNEDSQLTFNFSKHVESIGLTGWDWKNKVSRWVGFDFDAILGHADGHSSKLSQEDLLRVEEAAKAVPYVTVRRSTSGNGLHLYVFVEPTSTENHSQHAALARAILLQMGVEVGYNFIESVDVCGGNLWVWHRKYEESNGLGLKLIKAGTELAKPPKNWETHLEVIENRRPKALHRELNDDDDQAIWERMAEQRPNIPIDDEHKKIVKYLEALPEWETYYNPEYCCLITHTLALKNAYDNLKLKGLYSTNTSGSTTKNCFCFPLPKGGWVVYRFGKGVQEHSCWTKETNGWTRCYFNMLPTIREASAFFNGVENSSGGFDYPTVADAIAAISTLGVPNVIVPNEILNRPARLEIKADGRIIFIIDNRGISSHVMMPDWINKKDTWQKVFIPNSNNRSTTIVEVSKFDEYVRLVINEDNTEQGWYYFVPHLNKWASYLKDTCALGLSSQGYTQDEVKEAFGLCANNPWKQVKLPFKPEYPSPREWNKNAAQFRVPIKADIENLNYPTWTKVLNHLGRNLNEVVKNDDWCYKNGVLTGADYLKIWCAHMFQKPYLRLPYLFFYSEAQHTGKSTFHQALSLLMTDNGYVRADNALKDRFNEEVSRGVLCVVEELDLGKDKSAYNKIKDWSTSQQIGIRPIYQAHTQVPNITHWVQCANHLSYLPLEPGDKRIVVIQVDEIEPEDLIESSELYRRLNKEASDFLTELITLELPRHDVGRMAMPVINTHIKQVAESKKETPIQTFIREKCHYVPGCTMPLADFYDKFNDWLDPIDRPMWTKSKIGGSLPDRHPKGRRGRDNIVCIANLAFEAQKATGKKLVVNEKGILSEAV